MERPRTKRRIVFEVTDEQYNDLKKYLEYGFQQKVFSAVTDDIIAMMKKYGFAFVFAMIEKHISYSNYMERYMQERRDGEARRSPDSVAEQTPA